MRPRPMRPLLSMAALLAATAAPAACSSEGGVGGPLPYVAEFPLGEDSPEAQAFVLTPMPGPRVQVLPAPSPPPHVTPVPDRGEEVPFERSYTPAPEPGGQSASGWVPQPSVAWVGDGEYLAVVTFGSSSCPTGPHGIEVVAEREIEIHLGPLYSYRDVCTADMSGHVTVVELPEGITSTRPLVARFGEHEVALPAVAR